MKYKFKAQAIMVVIVTSILSPLLAWLWFLDVITGNELSDRVDRLWSKNG